MKKYYKVLTPDLKSISTTWLNNKEKDKLAVQYHINQWVYPNPGFEGSNLMVFDDLDSVHGFVTFNNLQKYAVCECKVKNPRKIGIFLHLMLISELNAILRKKKNKKKFLTKTYPPRGTIFCSAVRLTKIIQCRTIE